MRKIAWQKIMITTVLLLIAGLCSVQHVSADALPFSVQSILPENQIDKDAPYYDLLMKPNETQTIEVSVRNSSKDEVTLEVAAYNALTNVNGVIDYLSNEAAGKPDASMKYPFSTLVKVDDFVKVPANSTINVPVTISMPSEEFDGIILGGLEFIQKSSSDDDSSAGMEIRNRFRYVIPVKLSETNNKVKAELELKEVKASQVDKHNAIIASILNDQAVLLSEVAVDAKVTKRNSAEVLYQSNKKGMQIAPNTVFNFPIRLESKPFKAGKYTMHMSVVSGDQKWDFKKDFEITADEADQYNAESIVELDETTNWTWYIVGAVVGVIVLAAAITGVVIGVKRKKKAAKKKARKKKGGSSKPKRKSKSA